MYYITYAALELKIREMNTTKLRMGLRVNEF